VSTASAALLAFVAVLIWPARSSVRRHRAPAPATDRSATSGSPRRRAVIVALLAGLAAALLLGGPPGAAAGAVVAVATLIVVPRLEPRRDRDRRERVRAQAPLVIDLVAACLASGAALEPSLVAAAAAVGPPVDHDLAAVAASLRLGADPVTAWAQTDPALAGLARAIARSSQTGAPLADLLPRVAAEARAVHRAEAEARVRTASVRLTAPLGAAFLPAFVLLGVVPIVASWLGVLL
jgi:Flp pilus assembly protein TadB